MTELASLKSGLCTCGHSKAVHRNGRGRCLASRCLCMFAPRPKARVTEPAARARVTVDGSGVLLNYERQKTTPGQRILAQAASKKLENLLWHNIELAGLPLPDELEYRFAKSIGRNWRADAYYREARLLVEVDGGTWVQGRHNHPSGFEEDCVKLSTAAILGYRVIRVTGAMIRRGEAVELIRRALQPAAGLFEATGG